MDEFGLGLFEQSGTFDDLYPNSRWMDEIDFEGTVLFKMEFKIECINCKKPTNWIEGLLKIPLCSPECVAIEYSRVADILKGK